MDSSGDAGGEAFASSRSMVDDDGLLFRESLERGESAPGTTGARGSTAAPAPARGDIGGDGVTGGNVKPASPSIDARVRSVGRDTGSFVSSEANANGHSECRLRAGWSSQRHTPA